VDRKRIKNTRKNVVKVDHTLDFLKFKSALENIIDDVDVSMTECLLYDDFGYKTNPIKLYNQHLFNITISARPTGGVDLFRFEMYETGNGLGDMMMNILLKASINSGVEIFLIPGVLGIGNTKRDDTNMERLRKFYNNHGFKRIDTKTRYWSNKPILDYIKYDKSIN
jgi:hypothetical protein